MNYNILVIVAVCLIGSGTQAYTTADLSQYCAECLKDSSTGNIFHHAFRCDSFISCTKGPGDVYIAVELNCGLGLYFNPVNNVCDFDYNVNCTIKCNANYKFRNLYNCNEYYQCENGYFNTNIKSCPREHKFDETQQICIADSSCNPIDACPQLKASLDKSKYIETILGVKIEQDCPIGQHFNKRKCLCEKIKGCSDYYRLSQKDGVFEQVQNGIWVEQNCVQGYNFNLKTCTCSDPTGNIYVCPSSFKLHADKDKYYRIENNKDVLYVCPSGDHFSISSCQCLSKGSQNPCATIDIPMANNVLDNHGSYVHNSNVTIRSNAGYFNGSAYLVLPVTSGNDFQNHIQNSVNFKLSPNQIGNKVAIIGNGRCEFIPTYAIFLENARRNNPKLVVEMTIGVNETKEHMEAEVQFNRWYDLKVVKDGASIKMFLDGRLVREISSPGDIVVRRCAYGVGNMYQMANFVGDIKNFYLSKCVT